jgi:hypothetical protein
MACNCTYARVGKVEDFGNKIGQDIGYCVFPGPGGDGFGNKKIKSAVVVSSHKSGQRRLPNSTAAVRLQVRH